MSDKQQNPQPERPSFGKMLTLLKKDFMQHVKVELRRRQYAMTRAELRRYKDMRARKRKARERYNRGRRKANYKGAGQ